MAIGTELLDTISDSGTAASMQTVYDKYGIAPDHIADVVAFALNAPENTNITEFTGGPTAQPW
jgi:NADP-dependent 3-hydroxy acid dehydrogenase YdfG